MTNDEILANVAGQSERVREYLELLGDARTERDAWIRRARAEGISLRAIGAVADLHYTAIRKIEKGGG